MSDTVEYFKQFVETLWGVDVIVSKNVDITRIVPAICEKHHVPPGCERCAGCQMHIYWIWLALEEGIETKCYVHIHREKKKE